MWWVCAENRTEREKDRNFHTMARMLFCMLVTRLPYYQEGSIMQGDAKEFFHIIQYRTLVKMHRTHTEARDWVFVCPEVFWDSEIALFTSPEQWVEFTGLVRQNIWIINISHQNMRILVMKYYCQKWVKVNYLSFMYVDILLLCFPISVLLFFTLSY